MPQASGWIRPRIAPACTDEEALATRDSEARTGLVISLSCDDVLARSPPSRCPHHPARQPKCHTLCGTVALTQPVRLHGHRVGRDPRVEWVDWVAVAGGGDGWRWRVAASDRRTGEQPVARWSHPL